MSPVASLAARPRASRAPRAPVRSASGPPVAEARRVLVDALDRHRGRIALATSLGPTSLVILDLLHGLGALGTGADALPVFLLDTDLLFPETYALRLRIQRRFGIRIEAVRPDHTIADQAALFGPQLWSRAPDRCCALRKVAPLRRVLADKDAWITGLRRDQGPTRAALAPVSDDPANGLIRIAPLVSWTGAEVRQWLDDRGIPSNPLLRQGYPSVGCWPCTQAAPEAGAERAGRWAGQEKTECGIHHLYAAAEQP